MTRKKPSPTTRFFFAGIFLVGIISCLIFLTIYFLTLLYSDFSGNATLLTWNRIAYLSLPGVVAVSLAYFSRRQIKHLLLIHLLFVGLLLSVAWGIHTVQFNEQKQILQNYSEFIDLIRRGETEEAYSFMHPDYQLSHETLDVSHHTWFMQAMNTENISSPYSVHIKSNNSAIIVPDPKTNQWYHPAAGFFLRLEKFDGEWFFTGVGGLYLVD
ncbi:hypothetical protein [Candidatus Leptofilum sp.]|uniref:hypothetical protein n=1 Tax=Candidatus Leptofilum sp. TaxID=3241576 RepID=UPI003B5CE34F